MSRPRKLTYWIYVPGGVAIRTACGFEGWSSHLEARTFRSAFRKFAKCPAGSVLMRLKLTKTARVVIGEFTK